MLPWAVPVFRSNVERWRQQPRMPIAKPVLRMASQKKLEKLRAQDHERSKPSKGACQRKE